MKQTKTEIIFHIGTFLLVLVMAYFLVQARFNPEPNNCNKKFFDGCWADVKEYIKNEEGKVVGEIDRGDWVCVNVKNMSYERALEICAHETGHEIFAEYCENNIEECIEVTK